VGPRWFVPADARARRALDAAFAEAGGGSDPACEVLSVMGRALRVPLAAGGAVRFGFSALCGAALGAGDYLALARRFHTVVIDDIPRLDPTRADEARRFVVLIDTLYDHRVQLVASAEAVPDRIYREGTGAKMFERTASRLEEMQSRDYLALQHLT
jgi:cell division protein ZapE